MLNLYLVSGSLLSKENDSVLIMLRFVYFRLCTSLLDAKKGDGRKSDEWHEPFSIPVIKKMD